MSKSDCFIPNDIFTKDENDNIIYVRKDKHYIVNDPSIQYKLSDIEGYCYFLSGN